MGYCEALFQYLSQGSHEFKDMVKILSSCYRDASSSGTFSYTKARLVHSELLEKDFVEKRRELKQDGRTDKELVESYCFLLPDPSKGKVKSIYENMSKNLLDPTPKFDCHISKNATRVTSLLSYRAFELTQQYFYEYSFDDIKYRPRQVCPYAVVSFLYKGKEATPPPKPTAPLRSSCNIFEGSKAKSSYTVWSGQLLNGGRVVYQVGLRSSTHPFLPFKLPEKLEIGMVMNLDQVKRKIPTVLFSWDTYSGTREVLKSGMCCSLFELVDKSKHGNSLTALLDKLERERTVLVNTLLDKGFLFLLSSAQMVNPNVSKQPMSREPLQMDPHDPIMPQLDTFMPALHYALMKVRSNPSADLAAGVERQVRHYLSRRDDGKVRLYYMNEYKQNLDEQEKLHPAPKQKHNLEGYLRSYIYRPNVYLLAVVQAREMVDTMRRPPEYSPVSDWEGSDGQPPEHKGVGAQANGAHGVPLSQADNDPEKMRELLKLIQMWKRNEGEAWHAGEGGGEGPEGRGWEACGLKRKLEEETAVTTFKYLRRASLDNGGHGRDEECQTPPSLSAVMDCMGLRDTDLRKDSNNACRLMEMLATFNKAKKSSSGSMLAPEGPSSPLGPGTVVGGGSVAGDGPELTDVPCYDTMIKLGLPSHCDIDLRNRAKEDILEDQTAGSMSSLEVFSPCSSNDHHHGTEILGEGQMPWFLIPITGIKSEKYCLREEDNPQDPRFLQSPAASNYTTPESHNPLSEPLEDHGMSMEGEGVEEELKGEEEEEILGEGSGPARVLDQGAAPCAVNGIIDEALGHFSGGMQEILREEQVYCSSEPTPVAPMAAQRQQQLWAPGVSFSEYISHYTSPVPIHNYVMRLCERMNQLIHQEDADALPLLPSSALKGQGTSMRVEGDSRRLPRKEGSRGGTEPEPDRKHRTSLGSAPPTSISSLISQLKPEVFSSLVEIIKDVQKNAVKFYIHSQEQESDVCLEIKEYLVRLGNVDCNPQAFLESQNNLDKLLIIIQNEDIAVQVHKIPALVSLKKLPSVSFAGVDSLDDVKNHTYNELFVSGGFIVSDEFVLNPDFITHERLQAFLRFLEEQSTPESLWHWKVHCKTQKKLKELGRLNSDALSLLNLLTTYQKRHLVEFLPYHDCDVPSRHAPDLECLIRLQAHHTQHRHIIFLTERRFEMFPHYSSNGIVIANIDDIMNSFHSLIGLHNSEKEPPASDNHPSPAPPAVIKDECVDEEDMSLDSEDSDSAVIEEPSAQRQEVGGAEGVALDLHPLPPQNMEFQPPLPEQDVLDPSSLHMSFLPSSSSSGQTANLLDFEALKSAISQFKAFSQRPPLDFEVGGSSPDTFNVNPHQSFLCPAARTSFSGSVAGYPVIPAYPGSHCGIPLEPVSGLPLGLPLTLGLEVPAPSLSAPSLGGPQDQTGSGQGLVVAATVGTCYLGSSTVGEAGGQHGWAHLGTWGVSSACGTPTSQDDGALLTSAPLLEPHRGKPPTPGSRNSASGTPNSQGGTTSGPAQAGTMPGHAQGGASNPAGGSGSNSTPSSQGSLNPVPPNGPAKAAEKTLARGGSSPQGSSGGLLSLPQGGGSVNSQGRGGPSAPFEGPQGNGVGAISMGYRGLPLSSSRPRGCRERGGGGPCVRGFPPHGSRFRGRGRGGYYMDFTQDTYFSWGDEEYRSWGDNSYHTHRDGYNGW
ncbi:hypothetical protein AAFF_G00236510 [Aldrovandia affinis]|uniref:DUF3715 domain-containing protein n=1 Tax=Aldrovandia affinis TaxID=143900 RepID=A0AAD7RER5_9TELE|nr:hypothetical protein AAFF_G00236510 [Aldrovandia affinis]